MKADPKLFAAFVQARAACGAPPLVPAVVLKVDVDADGYASNGSQYFGFGDQLYYVEFDDGRCGHVRAPNGTEASKRATEQPDYWGIR